MSSNYRDIGEAMKSIYEDIPEDLDHRPREELIALLKDTRKWAGESYATYACFMGWADSPEEALQAEEPDEPPVPLELNVVLFLREWLYEAHNLSSAAPVLCRVTQETKKGIYIESPEYKGWLPKSQIVTATIMVDGRPVQLNFSSQDQINVLRELSKK